MKVKGKAKILKSGSAPSQLIKYLYHEQMKFLDKVQQRYTISNFEPQAAEDEHTSDDFDAIREANEDDMGDMTSVTQDAAEREFNKCQNSGEDIETEPFWGKPFNFIEKQQGNRRRR
jgi:hypothetical protein